MAIEINLSISKIEQGYLIYPTKKEIFLSAGSPYRRAFQ